MKLKFRLCVQSICALVSLAVILSAVFFVSVGRIRGMVSGSSALIGNSAAEVSANTLEALYGENISRSAADTVLVLEERLGRIENRVRMAAGIVGSAYTSGMFRQPVSLPLVEAGEISPDGIYLYIVPGVNFQVIKAETQLVSGVAEMITQIAFAYWSPAGSSINGESGFVISMGAPPWPKTDYDPRSSDWYQEAKATGKALWTDLHRDWRTGEWVVSCAVPFFDSSSGTGVFKGVASGILRLSDFSKIADPSGRNSGGQFFITDGRGTVVYSTDGVEAALGNTESLVGENFLESGDSGLQSLGISMTLGATGMSELEIGGIPSYVAYAPIGTLGWSLAVAVPAQEIYVPGRQAGERLREIAASTIAAIDRQILILAGSLAALLVLVLPAGAFFAARFTDSLTRPVLALHDGVRDLAAGNLEREVEVRTGDELEELAASFNVMASQLRGHIDRTAREAAEKQRISTEFDIAMNIQQSMLPHDFSLSRHGEAGFDLYAQVHPAVEIGGDFYDFFFIDDDRLAVLVADVSGKGIPAALFMAMAKTVVKSAVKNIGQPGPALEAANRELYGGNTSSMFVSLWLCVFEISSGRLTYVNAGHNPPMFMKAGQGFEFIDSKPDRVLAVKEDTRYGSRVIEAGEGDILFLYTDGIVEAQNEKGDFYGTQRMKEFLDANAGRPLSQMLQALRDDIACFACDASQSDDITMLALRVGNVAADNFCRTYEMGRAVYHLEIRADISNLDALMAFVGEKLEAAGCPEEEKGRLELAAEEIFVNIANYAYPKDVKAPGSVAVDFTANEKDGITEVAVVFTDEGIPFNPMDHLDPDVTVPVGMRECGGLGILMVRKIVDTMSYARQGKTNRLEFTKSWSCKEGT